MIESFYADLNQFVKITGNIFQPSDIVNVEVYLSNVFNGLIYQTNLWNKSNSKIQMMNAFYISRNCHFYYKLDLNRWISGEKDFDKDISFSEFIKETDYYQYLQKYHRKDYLPLLFENDKNIKTR